MFNDNINGDIARKPDPPGDDDSVFRHIDSHFGVAIRAELLIPPKLKGTDWSQRQGTDEGPIGPSLPAKKKR